MTIPVDAPTVAIVVPPLDQVPDPSSVSDVVAPAQTNSVPVIGVGAGLTVIVTVLAQPAGIV